MITIPGRIPIHIHPFFWVMVALIGWASSGGSPMGTFIWVLVIIFSVLIHEFGHALTARAFGQETHIELIAFGGVTHRQGPKLKLWQEFLIVLNGPLAGFLLFLGAFALFQKLGDQRTVLHYLVEVTWIANLFWTILNLLPVYPLDGGHLLRIILESLFGLRGVRFALILSAILALFVSYVFFSALHSILGGALFLLMAFESYRAWQSSAYISLQDDDESVKQKFLQAEEDLKYKNFEEAKRKLEEVRQATQRGGIYMTATEYLAHLLAKDGEMQNVYKLLSPVKNDLTVDSLRLLHEAAFRTGALKDAVQIGNRLYQSYPNYESALLNALSYALLGEVHPSVGWLQRAINDGLPQPIVVLHREEFDGIRHAAEFRDLESKLT